MLRALVALLLVGNGLLLAALLGGFEGPWAGSAEREPHRLSRQVRPEALQLTPAGPVAPAGAVATPGGAGPVSGAAASAAASAPGAGAAASAALAASAASGTAPAASPNPTAAVAPLAAASAAAPGAGASAPAAVAAPAAGPLACLQAGPFDAAQLAQAARVMRAAGLVESAWQSVPMAPARAWMVVMGPYADRTQMTRKEAELRRRNVEFSVLTPGPELPAGSTPGLSLGRHDSESAADGALNRLAARGVRSARVIELAPVAGRALLRVPAADAAQQATLAQLALPAALRWAPCPVAAAAATAPANGRR